MKRILQFLRGPQFPVCSLCSELIEIETANIDENGKAVHEECYVLKMLERTKKPPTV